MHESPAFWGLFGGRCPRFRFLASLFLAIAIHTCADAQTNNALVLFSLKKTAPVIDGELNEDCWKGAQVATGLICLGKIERSTSETEVMSCYDESKAYFAIKLREPNMAELKVVPEAVWSGDCVEMFLDPTGTGRSHYQIIVDSAANVFMALHDGQSRQISPALEAKARRHDGFWTVELAIPFSALATGFPKDNQRWLFNVGRERYTTSPPEVSSWAALGAFSEREKFGQLAFYSRGEVIADINYWKQSDADPLMRRLVVSGFETAMAAGPKKRRADLWRNDPFLPNRKKDARWECYGVAAEEAFGPRAKGEACAAEKKYPEFYRVAMGINRALVARSHLDEAIGQLRKVVSYTGPLAATTNAAASCSQLDRECAAMDNELNAVFQAYGRAFEDDWNKGKLEGLEPRCLAVHERISRCQAAAENGLKTLAAVAHEATRWEDASWTLSPSDARPNKDGTSQRLQFSGMRFYGHDEIFALLGQWDSINWDWHQGLAEMAAPGQYTYSGIDSHYQRLDAIGKTRRGNFNTGFGAEYTMAMPPWLAEKVSGDPEILVRSQDGLNARPYNVAAGNNIAAGGSVNRLQAMQPGMNPHHPAVMEFFQDYLKKWAAHANRDGRAHFFVSGWEDSNYIQVQTPKGVQKRSVGYNEAGKAAFRAYLKERYGSVKALNARWGTTHASFDAIQPPDDKYIKPPTKVTGLTYEFERWGRVEHARYRAKQRKFLREGAPRVPVMTDDSITYREMNGYLNFKENVADVCSYHSNPGDEEAMWIYLHSLSRRFGDKPLGYYENYYGMYTRAHMTDERLAKRDVRQFFFTLFMRDIRHSTWWLGYVTSPTEYVVAYGGGTFLLDYDQTILRWCTTELPVMFARGRAIERALLESHQEIPSTAIIQPCASIFSYASMGRSYLDSPPIKQMIDLHYQLLDPGNYPHEYLPEEMVLDGKASLNEYKVLFLPEASYMSEEFAGRLKDWTYEGGTLIAVGAFTQMNEYGHDLPSNVSLMKILFADAKPSDLIQTKGFGKGTVVYLGQSIDVCLRNASAREQLLNVLASTAHRTAVSTDADLKILVRDGNRGEKYLCVNNRNVEKALQADLRVKGRFASALDVVAPHGYPVPLRQDGNQTLLTVALDPADWTVIRLRAK